MNLFTLYWGDKGKGDGFSVSCTNKRVLSERTGIGYDKLVRIFTRERRYFYEVPDENLIIIHSKIMHKGGQRIKVNKSSRMYKNDL